MADANNLVERLARALSIPQHHTTWDTLTWQEKDLFYMQADYALKELDYVALSARIAVLEDWLCEAQIRAHEWMVAHDKLKAGKPYDFPKPAPLPERGVLIRLVEESLFHLRLDDGAKAYHERALASITKEGTTSG